MVTKLAGPFSDTWRCSISPRSRLRLRPARRAALSMTLIRAECSMISAQGDLGVRSGLVGFRGGSFGCGRAQNRAPRSLIALPVGALRLRWRQGGSFDVKPFARQRLGLGAIGRVYLRHGLVELGVAFPRGFRDKMPFKTLDDLVRRRAGRAHQHAREAVLGDRAVLSGGLAQQGDRGGFVLWRSGAVVKRYGVFDLGVDIVGERSRL